MFNLVIKKRKSLTTTKKGRIKKMLILIKNGNGLHLHGNKTEIHITNAKMDIRIDTEVVMEIRISDVPLSMAVEGSRTDMVTTHMVTTKEEEDGGVTKTDTIIIKEEGIKEEGIKTDLETVVDIRIDLMDLDPEEGVFNLNTS